MADDPPALPSFERKGKYDKRLRLYAPAEGESAFTPPATVQLEGDHPEDSCVAMSGDDLYWLVVVAGPAMIAALGGPYAARGIELLGAPPPPPTTKEEADAR